MSYEKFYEKVSKPFRSNPKLLNYADRFLTLVFYISYPLLLLYIFLYERKRILFYILIPAFFLALCTLVRKMINCPRPYERYQIEPIIYKDTEGQSFPSRHVFSAVLISMAVISVFPLYGAVLVILSFSEAYIRVAGGVHTPWDVLASIISALLCGVCFFVF